MRILSGRAAAARVRKLAQRTARLSAVEPQVRRIIRDIRQRGDRALRRYAERWDGLPSRATLQVPERQIEAAWKSADPKLRESLIAAAANIRRFCEWQRPVAWQRSLAGISIGQIIRPVDSVGCYVPGGRYPLISTLLMTVIPAQVAGVRRICVVSPQPRPEVLAAAGLLGVREVFRVGGAQAIAALAYGTESIGRVDKIVGPGNFYVTAAKKQVAFDCAIDLLAGPTEVVILRDTGDAGFIAADLVAQAEHDSDVLAVFITTQARLAEEVVWQVRTQSAANPLARQSLRRQGVALVAKSRSQAVDWTNEIAPEHLTIDPKLLPFIRNAGSIFIGDYSSQSAGDYACGPNHVLPTGGAARFRGGLTVLDFVKMISVQKLSRPGLRRLAPTVEFLAQAEGLTAHAESVRVRCNRA